MKRFKVVGLALVAALAVVALTVAAASAAMTLPEFTTQTSFKGTSGTGVLTSGGISITCKKDTSSGAMEASKKLGTFAIDFEKCTTVGGLIKCNSLADASETILTPGSWHLVLITRGGVDTRMLWFLPAPLHIECGSTLTLVTGTLLGSIKATGTTKTEFEIGVNVVSKNQEFTEFENDEGGIVKPATLKSAVNEGTAEPATEESKENKITTAAKTELIN
jgi:hypothetical protein